MQPINTEERRSAFINFLIFFAVTVGLIVTAVFFSVQVPFKQNDQLRKDVLSIENERAFNDAFSAVMSETMGKLDSVNLPDQKNARTVGRSDTG